jgi:hypothetical protein
MDTFTRLLRRWLSQDVARTNAAQAAVRLQHRRQQLDDVEAFLAAHHHRPAGHRVGDAAGTGTAHAARPRHLPH